MPPKAKASYEPEEYLAPGFDLNLLKLPQLRGILLEHTNERIGGTWRKPEMINAIQEQVLPKSDMILRSRRGIVASARGIVAVANDGTETLVESAVDPSSSAPVTPAKRGRGRPPKSRPSTGTLAPPEPVEEAKLDDSLELPTLVVDDEMSPASPPKKARKSRTKTPQPAASSSTAIAPPTTGKRGPGRPPKIAPTPSVDRASEQLATEQPQPDETKTFGRPRKSSVSQRQFPEEKLVKADRVQVVIPSPKKAQLPLPKKPRESGFSDANPFQSGSPEGAKQEKERSRRRQSSLGVSASQPQRRGPRPSEFAATSSPGSVLRRVGPSQENLRLAPNDFLESLERERLAAAQAHNDVVSKKLTQLSSNDSTDLKVKVVTSRSPARAVVPATNHLTLRNVLLSIVATIVLAYVLEYKNVSSANGYCDADSTSNARIEHLVAARACRRARTNQLLDESSDPPIECDLTGLPVMPLLPAPTECAPCPPRAQCTNGQVVSCNSDYLVTPARLSFLSPVFDGLPYVGPRAFPPSCQPDLNKRRAVGILVKEVEAFLARKRGSIVCAGARNTAGVPDAVFYGVDDDALKAEFPSNRYPQVSEEKYNSTFNAAMLDLIHYKDVFEGFTDNRTWYAASRTAMTGWCNAKLSTQNLLHTWSKEILGTIAILLASVAGIQFTRKRKVEKFRVEEIVSVVLKRLRDHASLHATDPKTTTSSFLATDQLRDLVLPTSTASRSKLWKLVSDKVEANANVATREKEVVGEVWKTWEWTGEKRITW